MLQTHNFASSIKKNPEIQDHAQESSYLNSQAIQRVEHLRDILNNDPPHPQLDNIMSTTTENIVDRKSS